jgi:hypothetical protein
MSTHDHTEPDTAGRPVRVQRRRSAGWRMPPAAVYVGRPTRWGNPFTVAEHGRAVAVARYRAALLADPARLAAARRELAGQALACWCPLDVPCHADVLLDLANTTPSDPTPGDPQ